MLLTASISRFQFGPLPDVNWLLVRFGPPRRFYLRLHHTLAGVASLVVLLNLAQHDFVVVGRSLEGGNNTL